MTTEKTTPPAVVLSTAQLDRFVVSVVVIKETTVGFNTQNKLYAVDAANIDEAHGKALRLSQIDFPEHRLHTICSYHIEVEQFDAVVNGG